MDVVKIVQSPDAGIRWTVETKHLDHGGCSTKDIPGCIGPSSRDSASEVAIAAQTRELEYRSSSHPAALPFDKAGHAMGQPDSACIVASDVFSSQSTAMAGTACMMPMPIAIMLPVEGSFRRILS
jgi:hypothetical protein